MVIIFHSFGAVIINLYFKLFGSEKVFGLIDLGGFPISMHIAFKRIQINMLKTTEDQML